MIREKIHIRCALGKVGIYIFLVASIPCLLLGQKADTPTPPEYTMEQRLSRLEDILERKRQEHHIPGMAVVVVKDDDIILMRGFGWADKGEQKPVTPETVFGLGSATKSFASTLIAMLVDEGKMEWDDPITRHLPYFKLKPKEAAEGEEVTLRDLLCHRTGYMRMNILWLNESVSSREEVLELVARSEPFSDFRKRFNYTNVGFLAAGEASASAGGKDWDTLIEERIFKPLGMTGSNTSIRIAAHDPKTARGYIWEQYARRNKPLPLRNMDLIGAAGTINSNVQDMAHWLRFHLNGGICASKQLLSKVNHQEMWNPQFPLGQDSAYGLGWFIRKWNGYLQVDHGGGIDGFNTQVAMLPEIKLGFVLLTNRQTNPLVNESFGIVWETLLGDKPKLPTSAEVLRLRRSDETNAIAKDLGTIRLTGKVTRLQSGTEGTFQWIVSGTDHLYRDLDFGRLGHVRLALNPENAALSNTIFPYQDLRGRFYEQGIVQNPLAIFGDWSSFYDSIEVTNQKEQNGRNVYIMRLRRELLPAYSATVDAETGDMLRLNTQWLRPGSSASMPEIFSFDDYREHQGLRIPFQITSLSPYHGQTVFQLEKVETNLDTDESIFRIPSIKEDRSLDF